MEYKITKRCERKVTRDFQSWAFMTELTKTINVESAEELQKASQMLFEQAKFLTEQDIQNTDFGA